MTRDEAIKLYDQNTNIHDRSDTPRMIDRFVALGMLKLDEPKSADQRASDEIIREVQEWNMIRSGSVKAQDVAGSMLRAFERAGLQIVSK